MRRVLIALALAAACHKKDDPAPEKDPLLSVAQTASWTIPGLSKESYVLYGEMGVPHVYAHDQADLGRVLGFTLARDRFFYMDLARRLSQGKISALLGAAGLETDLESRATGMTFITDHVLTLIGEDEEMAAYFDGFAAGVNAYIDAVKAGRLAAPSEFDLAAGLLGKSSAADLLAPFTRRDVVAGIVTVLYESGFETKDIGRTQDAARLGTAFDGFPEEALRKAGLMGDVWGNVVPPNLVASAPGWKDSHPSTRQGARRNSTGMHVEPGVLSRLKVHTARIETRLKHNWQEGFGSNAWAVDAAHSADGRAMLAADGHLQLSVPPILYQVGLDTAHLGGGDIHQVGTMTPALPLLATGTNGDIAFGQTQLMGDITDWYREELTLGDDGLPASSKFKGAQKPLLTFSETIDVAQIPPPLGDNAGGPYSFTRYTTFDGRWITSIEGDVVGSYDDGEVHSDAVLLSGDWVKPRDVDGDGAITAVSFDYTGLTLSNMPRVIDTYTKAKDIDEFKEATSSLVAYSLNLVAADKNGDIFFTGFQAVPCRDYLDRDPDGDWAEGADPNMLLDGTKYGAFTIPLVDGKVDFSQSADPYKCVVSYDDYPHEKSPAQGFVVSANNDPGGFTFDGSLSDDPVYIGGPWLESYRAKRIQDDLAERTAGAGATLDDMKDIQGDHHSNLGAMLVPVLLDAIEAAQAASMFDVVPGSSAERLVGLYVDQRDRFDEVQARLTAWQERGLIAESGVQTFYDAPDADQVRDAVATSIFNAWMGKYLQNVVGDEDLPGLGWPTGDTGKFRVMKMALESRGAGNPADLAAYNPATQEAIWFDIASTPELEESDETALIALRDALAFLESPETDPGRGGFGTADMDGWVWGMRHLAMVSSLLGDFLGGGDPIFDTFTKPFNITPAIVPLAEGMASDDPRRDLPGFPRPGDHLCIDALNSGTDGTSFDAGDASVNRTVIALGGEKGFEAYNIIPGGESGLTDSPNFADQARLWLGNQYLPLYLKVDDVVAHAERRETFTGE